MKKNLFFLFFLTCGMTAYCQNCYSNIAPAALNVRRTPSTNGAVIGTLQIDQEVNVVVINGDWAVINWDNGIAYVAAKFIAPCSAKPIAVENENPKDKGLLKNNPIYKKEKRMRDAGAVLTSIGFLPIGVPLLAIGQEQMKLLKKHGPDIYQNEQYLKARKKRNAGAILTGLYGLCPVGIPLLAIGQKKMNRIMRAEYQSNDSTEERK